MKFLKGQVGISILGIIGIGASSLIAIIGGYFTQSYRTDNKIQTVQNQTMEIKERTARLEEAVQTIKTENQLTRQEIKEVLKEIRAKR